jgi:uncharacterized protein YuzE
MEEHKAKAWYDKSVDIFYLLFEEGPGHEVIDADPDVHVELDKKGKVMGIGIWNARKKRTHKTSGTSHSRNSLKQNTQNMLALINLNFLKKKLLNPKILST